jgi:hypothetical protein
VTGGGISGGPNDGRTSSTVSRTGTYGVGAAPESVLGPLGPRAIGAGVGALGGEVRTCGAEAAGSGLAFEPTNAVDATALRCGGGSAARGSEPCCSVRATPGGAVPVRVDRLEDAVAAGVAAAGVAAAGGGAVVGDVAASSVGAGTLDDSGGVVLVPGNTDGRGSGEVCLAPGRELAGFAVGDGNSTRAT